MNNTATFHSPFSRADIFDPSSTRQLPGAYEEHIGAGGRPISPVRADGPPSLAALMQRYPLIGVAKRAAA